MSDTAEDKSNFAVTKDLERVNLGINMDPNGLSLSAGHPSIHQRDIEALIAFTNHPIACFQFTKNIDVRLSTRKIVDAVWERDSVCIEANHMFAKGLNRDLSELKGLSFGELFPPTTEHFEMVKNWALSNFILENWQIRTTSFAGKESIRKFSIFPIINANMISRVWISYQDVTEQTRLIEMLESAEQHYRTLVERPGLILVRARIDGSYEYLTPHVYETVGYPAEAFKKNPNLFKTVLHPDDVDKHEVIYEARRNKSKEIIETEYRVKHSDGTYHWFYERQIPKLDENGEVEFFDSIALDITRRKQLETDLRHAKRMETFGNLASGIAHDFNNHLAVILGQIGLCLNELDKENPLYDRLSAAECAALISAEIAKSLLSLSRKQDGSFEVLSVRKLIEDAGLLLKHTFSPSITLDINLSDNLANIKGNAVSLQQVLMNLAVNSRDAIKSEGIIEIKARNYRVDKQTKLKKYTNAPHGKYVEFSVIDNGCGIPSELLNQIFDPFFTTKNKDEGTGLGLSMVYSIIKSHSGWVSASSNKNVGTEISFIIPVTDASLSNIKTTEWNQIKGGEELILVADDDEMVLSMVTTALERQGYTVITARDGEEAVEKIKTCSPELVLLDYTMPKMSGREVLDSLQDLNLTTPVILTSGYGSGSTFHENAGVKLKPGEIADFISKPYQLQDLLLKVRQVLDEQHK
ncbi:MAG: response regulator [Bdellovibrionales bacterium]|nr:response regulator [Bdellovibrionales bacterium]